MEKQTSVSVCVYRKRLKIGWNIHSSYSLIWMRRRRRRLHEHIIWGQGRGHPRPRRRRRRQTYKYASRQDTVCILLLLYICICTRDNKLSDSNDDNLSWTLWRDCADISHAPSQTELYCCAAPGKHVSALECQGIPMRRRWLCAKCGRTVPTANGHVNHMRVFLCSCAQRVIIARKCVSETDERRWTL